MKEQLSDLYARPRVKFLDGLRAFAIIFVLFHHVYSDVMPKLALGNVGVVLFFALSGFLVMGSYTTPNASSPTDFYLNRIFRILPAYYVTIFVSYLLIFSPDTLSPGYLVTFSVNWPMVLFEKWPPGSLAPLWSIAVEMQFYLIAPLLFVSKKRIVALIILCFSFLLTMLTISSNSNIGNGGIYYSTFLYLPVFLAGGAAALYSKPKFGILTPYLMTNFGIYGLLLLIVLWQPFPPYNIDAFVIPFILPIIAFALLWGLKNTNSNILIRGLLEARPLAWVAKLSFSFYLIHLVLLYALEKYFLFERISNLYIRSATIWPSLLLFGWLLHKFIETPVLRMRNVKLLQLPGVTRLLTLSLFVLPTLSGILFVMIKIIKVG